MNVKVPYSLQVWDEKLVNGKWEETRLAILGADDMDYWGRAYNIQLKTDMYGETSLTFSLDSVFYNQATGEKETNYLSKYLFNEVKVKLLFDKEWYEFIIKQMQETHNNQLTVNYTCTQLATYELGKIGYNISFVLDENSGSAVQDARSFMETILAESDWAYAPAGEKGDTRGYEYETPFTDRTIDLVETQDEILYCFEMSAGTQFQVSDFAFEDGNLVNLSWHNVPYETDYKVYISPAQLSAVNTEEYIFCYVCTDDDSKLDPDEVLKKENLQVSKSVKTAILDPQLVARMTTYTAEIPKKSKYSEFITYTDIKQSANSIKQYCQKCNYYGESGSGQAYYRDITRNLDFGYTKTNDPAPAKRGLCTATKLLNAEERPWYIAWNTALTDADQFYVVAPVPKHRDGDTFDVYKDAAGDYRLIHNGDTGAIIDCSTTKTVPSGNTDRMLSVARKTYYLRSTTYDGSIIYTPYTNLETFNMTDSDGTTHTKDDWYDCTITGEDVQDLSECVNTVRQYFTPKYDGDTVIGINVLGYGVPGESIFYMVNDNGQYLYNPKTGEYSTAATVNDGQHYEKATVADVYSYNKYRTIEASKSNCFNLTQTVAETFEVYCRYYIAHEPDGRISCRSDGSRLKWVSLVSEYGEKNQIGFTYGLNTTNVQRNVDSSSLATKLYVEYCENSVSSDGVISIQNCDDNISRENFIYNFDYFIRMGLLDKLAVNYDLYNIESGTFDTLTGRSYIEGNENGPGYLRLLGQLNSLYDQVYEDIMGSGELSLSNQLTQYKTMYDAYKVACATEGSALSGTETDDLEWRREMDRSKRDDYYALIEKTQDLITNYTNYLTSINNRKKELNKVFEHKYARFIQEGSWSDTSYISADSYYYDALQVSTDAAKPEVTYTISMVDISTIEGWELFKYHVGDITWVEDVDYFGYDKNGKPYHEDVIVKEITYNLDSPSQTQVTIANKSDKFEDLFQKLSATVNSYQLNEQTYNRAANITSTGAIEYLSLQSSFNQNKALTLTNNDAVTIDNYGITVKNASNSDDIVRVVSGGIVLSNDGGETYTTGIYAGQLNTQLIKAGKINTEKLEIGCDLTNVGSLTFSGATIRGESAATVTQSDGSTVPINTVEITPRGMKITKAEYSTTKNLFQVDENGDLYLSGSIIGGVNTEAEAPTYYMGIENIKCWASVGVPFQRTSDTTPVKSKTYYKLTSGYMTQTQYNNIMASTTTKMYYTFSDNYYTQQTVYNYKKTSDTSPSSSKTYYTINSSGTFTAVSVSSFDSDTTYYEKVATTQYVVVDSPDSSKLTSYYRAYSYYQAVGSISAFTTGQIYFERTSNQQKYDWRILMGSSSTNHNFGVDSEGKLYATEATFSGNVYADGGVFNNVLIRNTCTVAGEAITGEIGGDSSLRYKTIQGGNGGLYIGDKIQVDANGIAYVNANWAAQAGYATSAGSAGYATQAGTATTAEKATSASSVNGMYLTTKTINVNGNYYVVVVPVGT